MNDKPTSNSAVELAVQDAKNNGLDVLDTSGLICPEPVMLLHQKIRKMQAGDIVEVIATDPSTQRDIPKFCTYLGHELISIKAQGELFFYQVKKSNG